MSLQSAPNIPGALKRAAVLSVLLALLLPSATPAQSDPEWQHIALPGGAVYGVETIDLPELPEAATRIRVAHLVPGAPAVDVKVDSNLLAAGLEYGSISDYAEVNSGRRRLRIYLADSEDVELLDDRVQLAKHRAHTVLTYGAADGFSRLLLAEGSLRPELDKAHIRMANVSNLGAVDIAIAGGSTLVRGLVTGTSVDYLPIEAGRYGLELRVSGSSEVLASLPAQDLMQRRAYTIIAAGNPPQVEGTASPPPSLILALDPTTEPAQELIAAGVGLAVSDRGDLWQDREDAPILMRRIDSTPGGVVFGVDHEGQNYRSVDGGRDWDPFEVQGDAPSRFLAISPKFERDNLAYAITIEDWRLYRLELGVRAWIEVILKPGERHEVGAAAISPVFQRDEVVLVGTADGVYRSEDSGQSWSLKSTPEEGAPSFGPEAGPAEFQGMRTSPEFGDDLDTRYDIDDQTVMAWNQDGVFRSDDAGESWRRLALEVSKIRELSFSNAWPTDPVIAVALADAGRLGALSYDGGETWQWIDAPAGSGISGTSVAMALDFGVPGFDIWYDEDRVSLIHLPFLMKTVRPFETRPYARLSLYPGTREIYLGTDGEGLMRMRLEASPDGRSQRVVPLPASGDSLASASASSVLYLPGSDGQLALVGTEASGLYRSEDGGFGWQQVDGLPRGTGQRINALVASPNYASDGTLFAAAESGLWVSRDRGRGWQPIAAQAPARSLAISPDYASDRSLIADGRISTDAGQTWDWLPGAEGLTWTAAAFSPRFSEDRSIWMAHALVEGSEDENPVWASDDAGASWTVVDASRLRRREVYSLHTVAVAVDPIRVFAGTSRGLVSSVDGGKEWNSVSGVPSQAIHHITSVVLSSPVVTAVIAAAGDKETVWSTNRGNDWQRSPRELELGRGLTLSEDGSTLLVARRLGMSRFAGLGVSGD